MVSSMLPLEIFIMEKPKTLGTSPLTLDMNMLKSTKHISARKAYHKHEPTFLKLIFFIYFSLSSASASMNLSISSMFAVVRFESSVTSPE